MWFFFFFLIFLLCVFAFLGRTRVFSNYFKSVIALLFFVEQAHKTHNKATQRSKATVTVVSSPFQFLSQGSGLNTMVLRDPEADVIEEAIYDDLTLALLKCVCLCVRACLCMCVSMNV